MPKQNKKQQKYSILKVISLIYTNFPPFFCNFAYQIIDIQNYER